MSGDPVDMRDGVSIGAEELFARAAAAETCAHAGLSVAIDDFFLPEAARLDERTRSGLAALLRAVVAAAEGEVRAQAVRLLESRGEARLAEALKAGDPVFARLLESGLLRDPELMAELLGRVRQDALGAALPICQSGTSCGWTGSASFWERMRAAARCPKTRPSRSEFEARRFAPWRPVKATSPMAQRPGTVVRPCRSVLTPPHM